MPGRAETDDDCNGSAFKSRSATNSAERAHDRSPPIGPQHLAIANWVQTTARQGNISLLNQKFVKASSRLSDGVVDLDPVEELLVALGRAGVINSFRHGLSQVHYLR